MIGRFGIGLAGAAVLAGAAAAQAPRGTPPLPDPANITFQGLKDLKWEGDPGQRRAKIYGDPDKPGPYAIVYEWGAGRNSTPHTHAQDRYGYVISGKWWMSSASTEDKSTLYPVPAGSFVVHKAGKVHWDGGVDGTAYVMVSGMGPIETKRLAGN